MTRTEQQPIQVDNNRFVVNGEIVPWFKRNETSINAIAPFPDHGRPVFLGSLIRANPVFLELARGINQEDSKKANARIRTEIERFLDQAETQHTYTLSSTQDNKPDIRVAIIGNPFDDSSLRLYFHLGEFNQTLAFYVDAIARTKDAKRVEKSLESAGYQPPKNMKSSKAGGGSSRK